MIKKVTLTLIFLTVTLLPVGWCNNAQGKEQANYNELRNLLDINLRYALNYLSKGDYSAAQQYFVPTTYIVDKTIITQINDQKGEFLIPVRQMNLRQRLAIMNGSTFTSIYEIYDAGYDTGDKYDDRTYTLDVEYVKLNGEWKISYLAIDE